MKIRIAGKIEDSLVNGDGIRFVLFTSGCKHRCPGCHNVAMQDFDYGDEWEINDLFDYIKNHTGLAKGITYSGGDPLEQSEPLIMLSKRIKKELGLSIWCYTGYTLDDILESSDINKKELLKYIDVLIDGKFELKNQSEALRFTGSTNQNIIHLDNGCPYNRINL